MTKISKGLAIAATVAAIGGGSLVAVAQTSGRRLWPDGLRTVRLRTDRVTGRWAMGRWASCMVRGGYGMMGGWGGSGGAGFADPAARLDALKTELAIRPEQTAAWDAYAKAVQDSAAQMQAIGGSIDFDKMRTMTWNDHQAYMGKLYDQRAAAFRAVHDAAVTLLAALDDTQKARVVLPELENFGFGMMGYGGYGMMGGGYGMMGWGPGGSR